MIKKNITKVGIEGIYLDIIKVIDSHEIKRCLLLGRKIITKLDSISKSRDIIFPTKVLLVNSMVFPVVMYGYDSWTIKKAEHQRTDAFNCGAGEVGEMVGKMMFLLFNMLSLS